MGPGSIIRIPTTPEAACGETRVVPAPVGTRLVIGIETTEEAVANGMIDGGTLSRLSKHMTHGGANGNRYRYALLRDGA